MKKIIINGGRVLHGKIRASGSKNAALPIIFACILTKGVSEIEDLPDIGDVEVAFDLLRGFGAKISYNNKIAYIDTTDLYFKEPNVDLVSKIRASTYLIGSCLSRFGRCPLMSFGGCNFALRPIDMHIDACLSLGARMNESELTAERLVGGEIDFKKASVGATVNAILLSACAEGETTIVGAAKEPHIDSLIDFLISCGADIKADKHRLKISGRQLHGGKIRIIGDMIEAGTYLTAGLITNGEVRVENCPTKDMLSVFDSLSAFGAKICVDDSAATAVIREKTKSFLVNATPYPGFPTDLQPIMAALMAANSGGKIIDDVWQTRFGYLGALSSFGVQYDRFCNCANIYPSNIRCGKAVAPDLRGGMACLLTALNAEGQSEIYSAEIILRGYENLEKKLRALGAEVQIKNI